MENIVDISLFRKLLQSLEDSDISIRLRISGEGWMDFSKVILLSESAMIVQDSADRKMIMNLRNVAEFEIDKPLFDLAAYNHYQLLY